MTVTTTDTRRDLLGIYLNDHLAGSRAGLDLARRLVRSHGGTDAEAVLARLCAEIAEDRESLLQIMRALGVPVSGYKVAALWLVRSSAGPSRTAA